MLHSVLIGRDIHKIEHGLKPYYILAETVLTERNEGFIVTEQLVTSKPTYLRCLIPYLPACWLLVLFVAPEIVCLAE